MVVFARCVVGVEGCRVMSVCPVDLSVWYCDVSAVVSSVDIG